MNQAREQQELIIYRPLLSLLSLTYNLFLIGPQMIQMFLFTLFNSILQNVILRDYPTLGEL